MRIYPTPQEVVEEIYGDVDFSKIATAPAQSDTPYIVVNMVSSLDGKVSVRGRSGAIGSDIDRNVMRVLRSKVDAVMVGSGTLRSERVSLTSEGRRTPEPKAVIVTNSLDIPLENILNSLKEDTLILVPENAEREKIALLSSKSEIVQCEVDGDDDVDLAPALRRLKTFHGINSLLVEGGPRLNYSLVSKGLVSEIFLTLSPKLLGGTPEESNGIMNGTLITGSIGTPELYSIHKPDNANGLQDELFLRYKLPKITPNFR